MRLGQPKRIVAKAQLEIRQLATEPTTVHPDSMGSTQDRAIFKLVDSWKDDGCAREDWGFP